MYKKSLTLIMLAFLSLILFHRHVFATVFACNIPCDNQEGVAKSVITEHKVGSQFTVLNMATGKAIEYKPIEANVFGQASLELAKVENSESAKDAELKYKDVIQNANSLTVEVLTLQELDREVAGKALNSRIDSAQTVVLWPQVRDAIMLRLTQSPRVQTHALNLLEEFDDFVCFLTRVNFDFRLRLEDGSHLYFTAVATRFNDSISVAIDVRE
ncbi:hypothetical protein PN836_015110 [Ningiella sp. W23]|uniref:hypothetical protein n=1 Tax=Ningiella sp. W23 TaxID=3023715 RepID=UPI0037583C48